jgi:succinate semialdehyde reductase (NADPH)
MMRANVLSELGGNLVMEELQDPEAHAGEVLIRVAACGVCHSDLHVIKGDVPFAVPCVLGHEVSGIVEAVGAGVTHVSPGDRVVTSFIMPCGTCRHCVVGHDELCEIFFGMNRGKGVLYDGTTRLSRPDGEPVLMYSTAGLAELCVTPATNVFRLPDNLSLVDSAVLGCSVFTSVGAVRNVGRVGPGDAVAVVATGGVGLNII